MDLPPQAAIERLRPEPEAQLRDRLVYGAVVEPDALDGVLLAVAPVACVEAQRRAARDGAELPIVVGESIHDLPRAVLRQCGSGLSGAGHEDCWPSVEVGRQVRLEPVLIQPLDLRT